MFFGTLFAGDGIDEEQEELRDSRRPGIRERGYHQSEREYYSNLHRMV